MAVHREVLGVKLGHRRVRLFEARIKISQTDTNPLMAETPESDIQCVQGQDTFAFAIPVHACRRVCWPRRLEERPGFTKPSRWSPEPAQCRPDQRRTPKVETKVQTAPQSKPSRMRMQLPLDQEETNTARVQPDEHAPERPPSAYVIFSNRWFRPDWVPL